MNQCKWYLLMRVEQIEGTTTQSAHFHFISAAKYGSESINQGYQVLAGFDKEPVEKSFNVILHDPRPPCPIDWRVVPKQWTYAAMDSDNVWWLYTEKPSAGNYAWEVASVRHDVDEIPLKTEGIHWRDSLYERPDK